MQHIYFAIAYIGMALFVGRVWFTRYNDEFAHWADATIIGAMWPGTLAYYLCKFCVIINFKFADWFADKITPQRFR